MNALFAICLLLVTLTLTLLITRVATMALMLTGLSREAARFQARSAFSGCGFTTGEAEMIVNHPVRRRIVMVLMLLGNAGIATVVATLMISFIATSQSSNWTISLAVLGIGLALLWFFASSRWVERQLNKLISSGLRKWTHMQVRDYIAILQLQKGYAVTEMHVEPRDWLAKQSLMDAKLAREGVLVLGIQRADGRYLGAPMADTVIHPGDTLVLYGPIHRLEELDTRRAGASGDDAHLAAMEEHEEIVQEEAEEEAVAETTHSAATV